MLRSCLLACLLVCLLLAPGCVAVVAGAAAAGTIQYVRNEAVRTYDAPQGATWAATLKSLRDQGYPVDPSLAEGKKGCALEVNDVKVWLVKVTPKTTQVRIRVGTFDTNAHREKARRILDGVAGHLGP